MLGGERSAGGKSSQAVSVEYAKVYGRLVSGEAPSILPKSQEVLVDGASTFILSDGGKRYELDGCFAMGNDWPTIIELEKLLVDGLNAGHTLGVIGLGIGAIVETLSSTDLSFSYRYCPIDNASRILGITDAACIDLESFERLSIDQLPFERLPLRRCEAGIVSLLGELDKGNALPLVLVLEAHNPRTDTIGRAYLADLGGVAIMAQSGEQSSNPVLKSGSLDKSANYLLSLLLEMQQASVALDLYKHPLNALLAECLFSGKAILRMCVDVVADGSVRSISTGLTLAECFRSLRSLPTPRFKDPSPGIISQLQEEAEVLGEEHRSVQREVRHLRKQLERLERSRTELQSQFTSHQSTSQLERFEYEYALTTIELEAVSLRDAIRECQVRTAAAEASACSQGLQSAELTELNVIKQRQVDMLSQRLINREHELTKEIERLGERLDSSAASLEASHQESHRLAVDVKAANQRIAMLQKEISEAARLRDDIQQKADQQSPIRRAHEREINTLRKQLEQARATEEKLQSMLAKNDARSEAHRQVLVDLERQLTELRMENERLLHDTANRKEPKREPKDSQVSQALATMQAEIKAEREAMHQLLSEFKALQTASVATQAPSLDISNTAGASANPVAKMKPPAIKNKQRGITKPAIEDKSDSDYVEEDRPRINSKAAAAKGKRAKNSDIPVAPPTKVANSKTKSSSHASEPVNRQPIVASILPSHPAPSDEGPGSFTRPAHDSSVKLWKPSSFIPNLKRSGDTSIRSQENAPLLANLNFDGDSNRSKRIKLPTKPEPSSVSNGGNNAQQSKLSIFRSAAVSSNSISGDASLLPAIIANFSVKIPPKSNK